jgi:hypothetical protein
MDTSVYLLRQNQGDAVETLAIQDLASACRIFMGLSYPDGPDSIPGIKRPYYDMSTDSSIADYLPPGVISVGICQDLSKLKGGIPGYEFRLGSSAHPHLKMRVQLMSFHQREVWVFSVDTHDQVVLQAVKHLSAEHAAAWRILVEKNSVLKHQIEQALARAGHFTPCSLLKLDLT